MGNLIYHAGTAGKIKRNEVTRAVCHTFRKTKDVFKKHGNKEINPELTRYNIDYDITGYENKTPDEIVEERIENEYRGKRAIRHDAVVLREIIANPSADMFHGMTIEQKQEKMDKFVQDAAVWFQKEFGKKNLVGISAHLDETNPHAHFAIMPMTKDGRISQKDFFKGPADLKRQHRSFREHMRQRKWLFAEENKYENFDDVPLPTYKANAKEIEAKRQEQQKMIAEFSEDKDLRQEALDKVYAEFAGLGAATIHKVMREELEEKEEALEQKRLEIKKMESDFLVSVAKKHEQADERLAEIKHMYELKQREDERNTLEKPTLLEIHNMLRETTGDRFGVLPIKSTGEPVLVEFKKGKPKRISEEHLIRELTVFEPDDKGGVFLDLRGSDEVSYVLGHYNSIVAKTRSEAHMDGMRTITEVHTQMALEMEKEKHR